MNPARAGGVNGCSIDSDEHSQIQRFQPPSCRTQFPAAERTELAQDIALRGLLQALVVKPADGTGRHCLCFGAKRLRAARQAGLAGVRVMIRHQPHDTYAQVVERQKRHGLHPLDLARFIEQPGRAVSPTPPSHDNWAWT